MNQPEDKQERRNPCGDCNDKMSKKRTFRPSVAQPIDLAQELRHRLGWRECNACDWRGPKGEAVMCGSVGPLCPRCHETTHESTPSTFLCVNETEDGDGAALRQAVLAVSEH